MRPTTRLALSTVVLGLALGLVGCGDDDDTSTPAVPAIDNPRDARGVDPCALLTDAELATLGITGPGRPGRALGGLPRCDWGDGNPGVFVSIFTTGDGLDTIAANSEPTTSRVRIEGYPALETFTDRGTFCQYDVGQAPAQAILAGMTNGQPDSCQALQQVVAAMLADLPPYTG